MRQLSRVRSYTLLVNHVQKRIYSAKITAHLRGLKSLGFEETERLVRQKSNEMQPTETMKVKNSNEARMEAEPAPGASGPNVVPLPEIKTESKCKSELEVEATIREAAHWAADHTQETGL